MVCYWYGDYYCKEYYSYGYDCKLHGRSGYGTYTCDDSYSMTGTFSRDYPNKATITWEDNNRSYSGDWYDWKFNGEGTWTDVDGTTLYSDSWYGAGRDLCGKVNCSSGASCLLTYPDGKTFSGQVDVDQDCTFASSSILTPIEGRGTVKYSSFSGVPKPGSGTIDSVRNVEYVGAIEGGYPTGQGKLSSKDIDYEYSGKFRSIASGFLYEGEGSLRYNGATYQGGWKDDKTHGSGIFTDATGCVRTGEWSGGVDIGEAVFTCPDGLDFVGKTQYIVDEETYRPFEGEGYKFISGD